MGLVAFGFLALLFSIGLFVAVCVNTLNAVRTGYFDLPPERPGLVAPSR